MPTVSVSRDALFKAIGKSYSKLRGKKHRNYGVLECADVIPYGYVVCLE